MKNTFTKLNAKLTLFLATVGGFDVENPIENPALAAPGGNVNEPGAGILGFWISRTLIFILPIAGMVGFLFFLWSGIQFLTSKGDPKALEIAKARLTYAVLGLIVIFLSYSITVFLTDSFGIGAPSGAGP